MGNFEEAFKRQEAELKEVVRHNGHLNGLDSVIKLLNTLPDTYTKQEVFTEVCKLADNYIKDHKL